MASNGESSQQSIEKSINNQNNQNNQNSKRSNRTNQSSTTQSANHTGNKSDHHSNNQPRFESNNQSNNQSNSYGKRNYQSSRPVRKKNNNYFNERPVFTCLVCCQDLPSFKLKAIFAIGPCNHMVCYYCSTKMRVLCEQNECPTCRQELSEVIFTTNKDLKFTKLETKRCVEYNSRYKIYFENELTVTQFHRLLEFRCELCYNDETLFSNLKELEVHLRKDHDLYLCELCVNHVKIFPSERRYYSRKDLIRHKKLGDPDNKSYKGHSSCHLCNTMFFDEDELLSHLKKDHYNCHFCDPSRTKMFFDNYSSLKQHFLDQHYICQEGFCRDEEITSAFANKFDLTAHKAQVHGGKMNKSTRVDLDIDFREGQNGFPQPAVSYSYSRNNNNNYQDLDDSESGNEAATNQSVPTQEDFPQLATPSSNLAVGGSSNYAIMAKNEISLKKTKFSSKFQSPTSNNEDFPALASTSTTIPSFAQKNFSSLKPKQPTIASFKKKNSKDSKQPQQQMANLKYADIASSFPPLAQHGVNESWNKPLPTFTQDDFPDMPIKVKKTKKKTQYVNVQKEAEEKKKKEQEEEAKRLENQAANTSNDNTSNIPNPLTNDGKMLSLKVPPGLHKLAQQEQMNSIKKLPPPGFQAHSVSSSNDNFNMNSLNNATNDLLCNDDNYNNENKKINRAQPSKSTDNDRKQQDTSNNSNNNDKKNLPSSSRTGYIYPSNFSERNENLFKLIKKELKAEHKFDQFRTLTDKFIRGHVDGDLYFRKCLDLFDKSFLTNIFSELLVLMPHIKKQNEILAAYERYFNYNKGAMQNKQRNQDGSKGVWILTNEKLEFLVCPKCQQVLRLDGKDGTEHTNAHYQNNNEEIKNN